MRSSIETHDYASLIFFRPNVEILVIFTNADFLSVYIWLVIFSYLGGNSIFVVRDNINSSPNLKDLGKCQLVSKPQLGNVATQQAGQPSSPRGFLYAQIINKSRDAINCVSMINIASPMYRAEKTSVSTHDQKETSEVLKTSEVCLFCLEISGRDKSLSLIISSISFFWQM